MKATSLQKKRLALLAPLAVIAFGVPAAHAQYPERRIRGEALPKEWFAEVSEQASKAARAPDVQSALTREGAEPVGSTPREFAAFIRSETNKYGKVVREAGLEAE